MTLRALIFLLVLLTALPASVLAQAPSTFREAKIQAKASVYADQGAMGDLYCGCRWTWVGESGGRMDLKGCGYVPRKDINRAARLEWEHIVPASTLGRQRLCWQNGGRKHCQATDSEFSRMEADLHNLYPAVGEVNADRSNFNYGLAQVSPQYGACPTRVDFKKRSAEPRDAAKGLVARITFYMADRYGLRLSSQQERLLLAWSRAFPVTPWERERNRRITLVSGVSNPFVDGRKTWTAGYRPQPVIAPQPPTPTEPVYQSAPANAPATYVMIVGNRKSRIYHVYGKCPSYGEVSRQNQVDFTSEQAAQAAGYRRARNCTP